MSIKRQFHFINVGRLKNTYKLNGDLTCKLSDSGVKLISPNEKAWVKLAEDEFLPVVIEKIERLNSQHLLKFKNINSAEDANIYQQSELLLEDEIVEDDEISLNCVGYSVFNQENQLLGEVIEILEIPGNPLLLIEMDKKEVMLPIDEEFIQLFDNENEKIIIQNFEELLEL